MKQSGGGIPRSSCLTLPPSLSFTASTWRIRNHQVTDDRVGEVGICVATRDPSLRERLEARRRELIRFEQSFDFDPARSDADFEALRALATKK